MFGARALRGAERQCMAVTPPLPALLALPAGGPLREQTAQHQQPHMWDSLPGLMAASVWMTSWMGRPVVPLAISRPSPLITPGGSGQQGMICKKRL